MKDYLLNNLHQPHSHHASDYPAQCHQRSGQGRLRCSVAVRGCGMGLARFGSVNNDVSLARRRPERIISLSQIVHLFATDT
jgi:hypothetical protein